MSFALSPFRVVTSLVFASAALLFVSVGCSQQAEGERCDKAKNGDADCDSGLICVPKAELLEQITDRCCLPSTTDQGDDRCTRTSETGTNNPTPMGGAAGADSNPAAGAPDQGGTAGTMSQGGTAGGGTGGGGTGGTNASGAAGAPAEAGSSGAPTASAGGAGGAP
jgi:hypothetical protein